MVDFVCFPRKLIIELDGPQHLELHAQEHDQRRTAWLQAQGFRVLRFRNHELDDEIWQVVSAIKHALAAQTERGRSRFMFNSKGV